MAVTALPDQLPSTLPPVPEINPDDVPDLPEDIPQVPKIPPEFGQVHVNIPPLPDMPADEEQFGQSLQLVSREYLHDQHQKSQNTFEGNDKSVN